MYIIVNDQISEIITVYNSQPEELNEQVCVFFTFSHYCFFFYFFIFFIREVFFKHFLFFEILQ